MIALAINTGIPMSEWVAAGDRAITTGLALLEESRKEQERRKG